MSVKRKRYSAVEKARIALEAIKGEISMSEIVLKYGVHATQVNTWKKQAIEHLPETFSDKKKQVQVEHSTQLSELYEQIGRLKVENEFLKKKCDVFNGK